MVLLLDELILWLAGGASNSEWLLPRPLEGVRPKNPSLERVRSLFDQGRIIGTEFMRLVENADRFDQRVYEALIGSGLLPEATGILLRDRNWAKSADDVLEGDVVTLRHGGQDVRVPATWLSQGYQSTIAWITDIIGWFFFERPAVTLHEMEGLVLIDEIDLHLHPAWQETLVPVVRKIFPRLQFVVTTHSPMLLASLKPEEIVVLGKDREGNVVAEPSGEPPSILTGSQIYDRYFGVRRTRPARLGAALRRYGVLSRVDSSKLDEEDRREIETLRRELQEAGLDPETGTEQEP